MILLVFFIYWSLSDENCDVTNGLNISHLTEHGSQNCDINKWGQ